MIFSIIVPVYGVAKYLPACIDSVLAQSFQDFEIILVDDGSPDACPAMCDAYAARDERITVIHKPNGGLVSARQAGLQAAHGEYVVNLDGDDWIAAGMLEEAWKIIREHQADIVSFAFTFQKRKGEAVASEPVDEGCYHKARMRTEIYPKILMDENMGHMFYYLCGKAIRRELLYPHQMTVDTGISLGEDVTCMIPSYLQAESVYISHVPMYFYRYRAESDSRRFKLEQYGQLILGVRALDALEGAESAVLTEQISRYTLFICFGLILAAVDAGAYGCLAQIREQMNNPTLQKHIRSASFAHITPKMKIAYRLLRKNRICSAYWFLRLCRMIKKDD